MSQAETPKSEPTPAAREPFRWRRLLQFKLRTLLFVVMPLWAAFFAWWSYRANQQRTAVAALVKAGASLRYNFQSTEEGWHTFRKKWAVKALGVDYFAQVVNIHTPWGGLKDADLEQVEHLSALRTFNLNYKGLVSWDGHDHPNRFITDSGLKHLRNLTALERLSLPCARIGDPGLEYIKRLTSLKLLSLGGTQVTDAGLEHLKGLTKLEELYLGGTNITDAGLEHLKGLTKLEELDLGYTKVTDAGVARLKKALPNCKIYH